MLTTTSTKGMLTKEITGVVSDFIESKSETKAIVILKSLVGT